VDVTPKHHVAKAASFAQRFPDAMKIGCDAGRTW
jgi:hypothetical protein